MEYIVKCAGKEYSTNNEYFYETALSLNDNGKVSIDNERLHFVINMCFELKVKTKQPKEKRKSTNSLYSLSREMSKTRLSYEDEGYLDEILGNDPYTPLY